jgi:hypothetical protein
VKRALLIAGGVVLGLVLLILSVSLGADHSSATSSRVPGTRCVRDRREILAAQSVPGAQYVPCITDAVDGWTIASESFSSDDGASLRLTNDNLSGVVWTVTFTNACTPGATDTVSRSATPATVYEQTTATSAGSEAETRTQWLVFEGGCVVSAVTLPSRIDRQLIKSETDRLLALVPRSVLDAEVRSFTGGSLGLDPGPPPPAPPTTRADERDGDRPARLAPRTTAPDDTGVSDGPADDKPVGDEPFDDEPAPADNSGNRDGSGAGQGGAS